VRKQPNVGRRMSEPLLSSLSFHKPVMSSE
jgi:hypothetical protein